MKITSLLAQKKPTVSFEFFPPKTDEGMKNLEDTITSLGELSPSFVSITYGAGGSTRQLTTRLVADVKERHGIEAMAHLTCVGHSRAELKTVLTELAERGVENVLALRGDPPRGQTQFTPAPDGFCYGSELVAFIRDHFSFCRGVAGYPEKHVEASSAEVDLQNLAIKIKAGGEFVITQLFFDNEKFFQFTERLRAAGIQVPIIAGLMPVTDVEQLKRFTSMCGATIPPALLKRLEGAKSKEEVGAIGVEWAITQARGLLAAGVAGLHFYTLNRSHATREIYLQLRGEGLFRHEVTL